MINWKSARGQLGIMLTEQRIRSGFTQQEVARRAQLKSAQYISNIERGQTTPSLTLFKLMLRLYESDEHMFIRYLSDYFERELTRELCGTGRDKSSR